MMRILLVDDEPLVVGALQRMLRRLRPDSRVAAVTSGPAALHLLEAEPFDLVITDLDLPEMDGFSILERVRDRHPQVTRLVLSGCEDPAVRLRTVTVAHRFLAKPCEIRDLLEALEHVEEVRRTVTDAEIAAAVGATEALPAAPPLYAALTRALTRPETSMHEVARIISTDDAMSTRVLQVVNSAFFGLPQEVSSITQAVAFLGLQALKSLVLSVEAFRVFRSADGCAGFSLDAHKMHVLLTARIASRIVPQPDRDEAFTAGLLHDVGKLVLASRLQVRYAPVLEIAREEQRPLHTVERELLGLTHGDAGAALLRLWGLPAMACEAAQLHHSPAALLRVWSTGPAVHVANVLAYEAAACVGLPDGDTPFDPPDDSLIASTGVGGLLEHYRSIALQEASRVANAGDLTPI
jgi:HD-like signal output (HDOD) protein